MKEQKDLMSKGKSNTPPPNFQKIPTVSGIVVATNFKMGKDGKLQVTVNPMYHRIKRGG